MTFEISDFFAPSNFSGVYEPRTPLRKHLFMDCKRCRELNEATFLWKDSEYFAMTSYWLEVKKDSIRGAIGLVSRVFAYGEWTSYHHSYIKFSDGGKLLRLAGDAKELESTRSLIEVHGYKEPVYPLVLHLMEDHYDQAILEGLVNNPGWIPNGWDGWFEELPKKMLPSPPKESA